MDALRVLTPVRAIRAKCLDCTCGSSNEVQLCPVTDCSLYPYRLGKNPNIKREYTDEQRQAIAARLHKNTPTFQGENLSGGPSGYKYPTDTLNEKMPFETSGANAKNEAI
jgi:hypothetical protein